VKKRRVVFSPEAEADLEAIYDFFAEAAAPSVAISFVEKLETYCVGMALASERGHRRDDVRRGLRIVGFERRVTIALTVSAEAVNLLRIFYAGWDWETEF
jgi:toxin ParE1/3/4